MHVLNIAQDTHWNYSLFIWNSNLTGCCIFYLASLCRGWREEKTNKQTNKERHPFIAPGGGELCIPALSAPGLRRYPQHPFILIVAYHAKITAPQSELIMIWTKSSLVLGSQGHSGLHVYQCPQATANLSAAPNPCKLDTEYPRNISKDKASVFSVHRY